MNYKSAVLYGIAIWALGFFVSILIFPLHASERPLFESIMPVGLVAATTIASIKYFQVTKKKTLMVGLHLGLIWLALSIIVDLLLFSWGPMKMSIGDYMKDIGITYLLIPIITSGIGYVYENK